MFLLQGDSPELDLIALGGTETPEDIIFDPLLEKPPDQQPPTSLHRPLQRTSLTVPQPPQIPKFSKSRLDPPKTPPKQNLRIMMEMEKGRKGGVI